MTMVSHIWSFFMYYGRGWQMVYWLYRAFTGKTVLAVIMYHRVVRESNPDFLQGYEKGMAESDYLAQLREIEKHFDVISLDEFADIIAGSVKPRSWRPLVLLTFDDGDSENFTLAFPPLFKRRVPGVSFIATDFIDTPRRFYHLRVTNAFNNFSDAGWTAASQVDMPQDMASIFTSFSPHFRENKYAIRRALIRPMDTIPPVERDSIIDAWEAIAGGRYTLGIQCMSWEEISSLPSRGIAVGSHTVNHNKLELVAREEARRELIDSKVTLEAKLGAPITSICYPQGSFNDEILTEAGIAGYGTGFTTIEGIVDYPRQGLDRLAIPRIGIGRGKPHQIVYPFGKAVVRHLIGRKRSPYSR